MRGPQSSPGRSACLALVCVCCRPTSSSPSSLCAAGPLGPKWIFSILHLTQKHLPRKPFLTAQPRHPTLPLVQPVLSQLSEGTLLGYLLLSLPSLAGRPGHACFAHLSWTPAPGTAPGGSSINTALLVSQPVSPYDIYINLGPNVIMLKETKAPNPVSRTRLSFSKGLLFLSSSRAIGHRVP